VKWWKQAHPGLVAPSVMTLRRYLRDKPGNWFVTPMLLAEIVSDRLPHLLVAEEQAENILLLKRRLRAPVEKERQLEQSPAASATRPSVHAKVSSYQGRDPRSMAPGQDLPHRAAPSAPLAAAGPHAR
jgi:hypothetical protein